MRLTPRRPLRIVDYREEGSHSCKASLGFWLTSKMWRSRYSRIVHYTFTLLCSCITWQQQYTKLLLAANTDVFVSGKPHCELLFFFNHITGLCLSFSSPTARLISRICLLLKVLAGMNVHPAEFDGLKQEYNVKGYPTFCFFEWVGPFSSISL